MAKGTLRVCSRGHHYYKSSDCPVCPVCEQEKKPQNGFLSRLSAPARRALVNAGINSPEQLASHTEKAILSLHGMGPSSLPVLRAVLKESNLAFRAAADRS